MEQHLPKRTELTELGEFGLIDRLTADIVIRNESTIKGVGDDAAVISGGDKVKLVSSDLLIEGIHFDLTYYPLKHLGYKAAAVNISDIAAMNGVAKQLLVAIAVSNRFSVEAIDELYKGIKQACDRYNVDFVGGDTTSSIRGLFISVTVIGEAEKDDVVYRKGAKVNDLLCVSGDLGSAYMGLLVLEREKAVYQKDPAMQPDLAGYDYLLERQLKPEPRTDIIELFKRIGLIPTSMIDVSDGLASEALHLCKNSGLGCRIYENKIPIDPVTVNTAKEFNLGSWIPALNGGEDYELLFTIDPKDYDKIKDLKQVTVIGYMTDASEGAHLVSTSDTLVELKAQGWDALRKTED